MELSKVVLGAMVMLLPIQALAQGVPLGVAPVGKPSAMAYAVQCPSGTLSCFGQGGSGAAVTQPVAVTPTTIAAAGVYQPAAPAGRATPHGGVVQPGASAGLTVPTGGQICQLAVGSTAPITFPATSGPVYVYGTAKGDTFSGSVS